MAPQVTLRCLASRGASGVILVGEDVSAVAISAAEIRAAEAAAREEVLAELAEWSVANRPMMIATPSDQGISDGFGEGFDEISRMRARLKGVEEDPKP